MLSPESRGHYGQIFKVVNYRYWGEFVASATVPLKKEGQTEEEYAQILNYCRGRLRKEEREHNKVVRESTTALVAGPVSDVHSYPHVLDKKYYSKWTSTTYANPSRNFTPPPFIFFKDSVLKKIKPLVSTGIWFAHNPEGSALNAWGALVGLMFPAPQSTYDRPTDYKKGAAPRATPLLELEDLMACGDEKTNEAMLKLRCDPRNWHVCIFEDNIESRLFAQIQAGDLQRRLARLNAEDILQLPRGYRLPDRYEVPLCFYRAEFGGLRGTTYRRMMEYKYATQCVDCSEDPAERSSQVKLYRRFLALAKCDFTTVTPEDLTEDMMELLNSLTTETQEVFLLNYLDKFTGASFPPFFKLRRIQSRLLLEALIGQGWTDFSKTIFSPEMDQRYLGLGRVSVEREGLRYLTLEEAGSVAIDDARAGAGSAGGASAAHSSATFWQRPASLVTTPTVVFEKLPGFFYY